MPRKKNAKGSAKRQTNNTFTKIQKDFLDASNKLASQLDKEIKNLKQKENKLKNAINKVKAQIDKSDKRVKAASKSNNKKQINAAKKMYGDLLKSQQNLNQDLQANAKSIETTSTEQAKTAALAKQISQFDKEWAKTAKQTKVKAKTKKAKTETKKTTEPKHSMFDEPTKVESFETALDTIRHETNATEVAS